MDLNLKGKNILITGGSRGIGKGIAKVFVDEGAKVGIVARNKSELIQTKEELGVQIYQKDLSNELERDELVEAFINDFGSIDVLINNLGASHGRYVLQTDPSIFEEAMELNFISAVHLSKLATNHMITNGKGVILNISSIYGKEAGGTSSYNASKAALISFTKSFSSEVIKQNVRVAGIAPGAIYHPNKEWERRLKLDPKYLEKYANERIPAGRLGRPQEIGNVAAFLASDKASWIVGTTVTVDGGQSRLNY